MTKRILIWVLAFMPACGAPFTAGLFTEGGEAGGALEAGAAGSAGSGTGAQAGSLGAGSGGAPQGGAGAPAATAGVDSGAAGAAPLAPPPCAHAVDTVSPGYLSLGRDSCYRTKEVFDTITCIGTDWDKRTIKVNGQLAVCNETQPFPPPYEGYNYFEITGAPPDAAALRWSLSTGAP